MPNLPLDACIDDYMYYCQSRQLSTKTMLSYEQTLKLFQRWCAEQLSITDAGKITERVIRRYIVSLQERGKYTYCANDKSKTVNHPENRRDFRQKVSSITINNYLRNLRAFFNWLDEETVIDHNPMKKIKPLKCQRTPKEYLDDAQFNHLVGVLDLSYFSEYRDYVMIMMEVMQCGLNWNMMLNKREIFRSCFDDFDFDKIACYTEADVERIMCTDGMIKSRRKIEAVIHNAICFQNIIAQYDSFSAFIWGFTKGKTYLYSGHQKGTVVAKNCLSDAISKDLKSRGFKYLGSVTVYSHLQACGIINDHLESCFRYQEIIDISDAVHKREPRRPPNEKNK